MRYVATRTLQGFYEANGKKTPFTAQHCDGYLVTIKEKLVYPEIPIRHNTIKDYGLFKDIYGNSWSQDLPIWCEIPIDWLTSLREAVGGAFDGVNVTEFVHNQRCDEDNCARCEIYEENGKKKPNE